MAINRSSSALKAIAAALAFIVHLAAPQAAESQTAPHRIVVAGGASSLSILDTPELIAQRLKFFDQEGLAVDLQHANGAAQMTQLVAANRAQIGKGSFYPLVLGYEKGLKGKFFRQYITVNIFQIGVLERGPVASLNELGGKRCGVASMASVASQFTKMWLRAEGVPVDTISFLPVGTGAQALTALRSNQVDALCLWTAEYANMEAAFDLKLRKFASSKYRNGDSGWFASDAFIKANPAVIVGFSRAINKAIVFLESNPEAGLQIFWDAVPNSRIAGDPESTKAKGLIQMRDLVDSTRSLDADRLGVLSSEQWLDVIEFAQQLNNGARVNVTPGQMMTNDFIEAANNFDKQAIARAARSFRQ